MTNDKFTFPRHLTSISAIPRKTCKHENRILSLECCTTEFTNFKHSLVFTDVGGNDCERKMEDRKGKRKVVPHYIDVLDVPLNSIHI